MDEKSTSLLRGVIQQLFSHLSMFHVVLHLARQVHLTQLVENVHERLLTLRRVCRQLSMFMQCPSHMALHGSDIDSLQRLGHADDALQENIYRHPIGTHAVNFLPHDHGLVHANARLAQHLLQDLVPDHLFELHIVNGVISESGHTARVSGLVGQWALVGEVLGTGRHGHTGRGHLEVRIVVQVQTITCRRRELPLGFGQPL
mmetsp:Transcript_39818/g.105523  ORF Transcript_39818/g.105523 Transcript_39818/m.105523 type:complete len:202 (-) Transcript_39818:802-1407(-)